MQNSEQEEVNLPKPGFWTSFIIGCWVVILQAAVVALVIWVVVVEIRSAHMKTKLEKYEKLDGQKSKEFITVDTTKPISLKRTTDTANVEDPSICLNNTDNVLRSYRLSSLIVPITYELRLRSWLPNTVFSIPSELAYKTCAELSILIHCLNTQSNITMNVGSSIIINETSIMLIEIDSNETTIANSQPITLELSMIIKDNISETFAFLFNSNLQKEKYYRLSMNFEGTISSNQIGYYRSSYTDANGSLRWSGITQFEAGLARQAFPCFDEPSFKAKFNITLIHPRDTAAISNGPEIGIPKTGTYLDNGCEICLSENSSNSELTQKECSNYWHETSFELSPLMSSYLVAWVVAPFKYIETNSSNNAVKFRAWSRPEMLPYLEYALFAGKKVMKFFEEYFNVTFPLPKMDQVAIPDFTFGAMENWGIITYRESKMVFNEKLNDPADKEITAIYIAHEMSHQWFGNLVTMKWWDDLWLNEGFATYMEIIGTDYIEDYRLKMDDQFVHIVHDAMELDQYESTHPLSTRIESALDADQVFDDITYAKGASILRMLNYTIGETAFRKGVNDYLSDLKFKNADHDDLWNYMSEATQGAGLTSWSSGPLDIKLMMNHWTLKPGFPTIIVVRNHSHAKINTIYFSLTQDGKFSALDSNDKENEKIQWYVPIWYQAGTAEINQTWLTPTRSGDIRLSATGSADDWLLVNPECRGYYRVNYDYRSWQLLTAAMLSSSSLHHFDVRSRSMLLSDSFKFARIGMLNYTVPINLTNYLKHERNYIPWKTANNEFKNLRQLFLNHKDFDIFQKYMQMLSETTYKENTWKDNSSIMTEPIDPKLHKLIVELACQNNVPQCSSDSEKMFGLWQKSCGKNRECDPKIIPNNLKNIVYCEAVRSGGVNNFLFLMSQFTKEKLQAEKNRLLHGMACADEEFVISKLLSYLFDETQMRINEASYVLERLAMKPGGSQRILNFIKANWELLEKKLFSLGSSKVKHMFSAMTAQFNSDYNVKQFEQLEQDHPEFFKNFHRVLQNVRSKIRANVAWMNKYGTGFIEALKLFI